MHDYTTYKQAFEGYALPFAYVDLDLLDENIRAIATRANGTPVRVASKSIRSRAILNRIFESDPIYQGVMCFTVSEAVWLSQHGFDDLLLGYPAWHPAAIRQACAMIQQGKTITLMIDSVAHVEHLQRIAAEENVTLPLCLDVDMSIDFPGLHFGVWRSSVFNAEDALKVFDVIKRSPNLRLDGIMGYEAQIAGLGDKGSNPKTMMIRLLKRRSIQPIAERRAQVVDALQTAGAALRFVNGGGTGSIETTIQEPAVTEVTAGSGFFAPGLFDHYQGFHHQPAAGFAIEVVRSPKPGIYTCHGGGYIASGEIGKVKQPVIFLPEGAKLTDLEGAGEVQTPVQYKGKLQFGDPVFLRHSKAGELCERFNTLLLVQGGQVIDEIPTYRGEGMAFL